MANLYLRVWCLAGALLLWSPSSSQVAAAKGEGCKNLRDDVKTLLSLTGTFTSKYNIDFNNQRKIGNDRFTHMTKTLAGLVTSNNETKPLINMVPQLHQKIDNVTAILLRNEELTKKQNKDEVLEGIMKSIQTLTSTVESLKKDSDEDRMAKDNVLEKMLNMTESKIDDVMHGINNLTNFDEEKLRSICVKVIDTSPFAKLIADGEALLGQYTRKLDVYDAEAALASGAALEHQARLNDTLDEMIRQSEEIAEVQKLLVSAEGVWKDLPRLSHLNQFEAGTNHTLDAITKALDSLNNNSDKSFDSVMSEIRELSDQLRATNASLQRGAEQAPLLIEQVLKEISPELVALRKQMESLTNSERKILEIYDSVKASKKKIDHLADHVALGVGKLMLTFSTNIKKELKPEFKKVESSVMSNQALLSSQVQANVTEQMKTFWRQLGPLEQQLKDNKGGIDNLAKNTEKYSLSSSNSLAELSDEIKRIKEHEEGSLSMAIIRLQNSQNEFERTTETFNAFIENWQKDVQDMQEKLDALVKNNESKIEIKKEASVRV